MPRNRFSELAALHALGALDESEAREFQRLLAEETASGRAELRAFENVAAALAKTAPSALPSPGLKERLMRRLDPPAPPDPRLDQLRQLLPPLKEGLGFVPSAETTGWLPLPVRGAYFRLLSLDQARGCAVALGKLDPGAHYPAHRHFGPEDIYMLSGDLHIGPQLLRAGDYHHAAAGSSHPVNHSDGGCTLLIVISTQDLMAQMG